MKLILSLASPSILLAAPTFAQAVHLVDFTGANGAFTKVQPAVDAAADGDLLLVKTGTYNSFTVDGKGLVVAADVGENVVVKGAITLKNLPSGRELVLHDLTVDAPTTAVLFAVVTVQDCAGHVQLQDLQVEVRPRAIVLDAPLKIERSAAVAIVDSRFDAQVKALKLFSGAAVNSFDSNLFIHGSELVGANGKSGNLQGAPGERGAAALELSGGFALIVDSQFTGGRGGNGNVLFGTTDGGDGGPAVNLTPGASGPGLVTYDSTLAGGAPGTAAAPSDPGIQGWPTEGFKTAIQMPAAFARCYQADAVVRDGVATTLSFTGQPFDFVWHVLALDVGTVVYMPGILGAFHPGGSPSFFKFLGTLDALGQKDLTITLSRTGLDYVPVYEQALMFNATEGFVASNPRFVAFLDALVP